MILRALGYATGQFGKNHLGDRDEHLPTNHGFDEFFGNLYHLNAEEEPESEDYPGDAVLANGKTFKEQYGPRGVIHSYALPDGTQKIEDTGPLTKKRMETVDDETSDAAIRFIEDSTKAGKPVIARLPEIAFIDDKAGEPVGIWRHIGRRPILAVGNSDGDDQMLEWTTAGAGPRLGLLLHHDDAQREYAYDREGHIGRLDGGLDDAGPKGWRIISMERHWKRVFPSPATAN